MLIANIFMFSIDQARISLAVLRGNSIRNNRTNRGGKRHRRSDWLVFPAQTCRSEFQGSLPVSSGKNSLVHGELGSANIPLFWLRRGRQCFPIRNGIRARRFSSSRTQARGTCWHHHSRKRWRG